MAIQLPQKISTKTSLSFLVDAYGLYIISVTARCYSKKQSDSGENEMLRAEIDDVTLREIPPKDKPQYNNIPPSWNGTTLRGLAKTVNFIIVLNKGPHFLRLTPVNMATVEKFSYRQVVNPREIVFSLNEKAEDGDKRPWHTFALIDLSLQSLSAEATVSWHFLDGDDIKLIIDDKTEESKTSARWKYWIWSARPLQLLFGPKRERKDFVTDLPKGTHYVEFWADKNPTLHKVVLNLGDFQPKRIPTVDDPEWTGNFVDDPEQMILARALFGEIRDASYPDEARIAVGWSIRNRVEDSRWSNSYREVITKPFQYSAFNPGDPNRKYVENPLFKGKEINRKAWQNAYVLARQVIRGEVNDPTHGANHYYDSSIDTPAYLTKEKLVFTIKNDTGKKSLFFYRL